MSLLPSSDVPPIRQFVFWMGCLAVVGASVVGCWLLEPAWPAAVGAVLLLLMFLKGSRTSQNKLAARMAQFEQEIQTLQRSQANKLELLATVSHELRTPLNVVMGLHPIIQERVRHDEHAQALLDQMQTATQNLLQVFQGVLDSAQSQSKAYAAMQRHEHWRVNQGHAARMSSSIDNKQEQAQEVEWAITHQAWRFLVVDDNPLNELVLRLMLEKLFPNASVVCVNDAYAAMEYLSAEAAPDLMLLDVRMPDMDGYDLTRWVRSHVRMELAHLPIVAITGAMRSEDVVLRKTCGINDVVYKPLEEQRLCDRVCYVLHEASNRGRA